MVEVSWLATSTGVLGDKGKGGRQGRQGGETEESDRPRRAGLSEAHLLRHRTRGACDGRDFPRFREPRASSHKIHKPTYNHSDRNIHNLQLATCYSTSSTYDTHPL